jgi:AraC-like DNA-binding protein
MTKAPIHIDPSPPRLRANRCAARAATSATARSPRATAGACNDVVCTCGPRDHEAEERPPPAASRCCSPAASSRATGTARSLLSEGSLFLVEAGHCFACSHRHGEGDRCLSFQFEPELFERIAHDAGATPGFAHNRLPPLRALSRSTARARSRWRGRRRWRRSRSSSPAPRCGSPAAAPRRAPAHHHGRMSEVLRYMASTRRAAQRRRARPHGALSPYHFLRSFKAATGVTPHQWLLRARLHQAAARLATSHVPVTDIALEVGFEDLSNFTRTFRAEFGASPRQYRLAA